MNEPGENGNRLPDVEEANLRAYERVFRKALSAADRILKDHANIEALGARLELAKMLFERFYSDQATITQATKNAEAMIKSMTAVLETRR